MKTMSETLRAALQRSGMTPVQIERATGLQRGSILRFIRREHSLRLDLADLLAVFFKLQLRPARGKRKKGR